MGLDMYAYATREKPEAAVDFTVENATEFHYWRKHPNLHGWMERLYRHRGGSADDFNCVNVQLTVQDLDRLESDIKANMLPYTTGFFFGASEGDETEGDLAFIRDAREALSAGMSVFYSSWW